MNIALVIALYLIFGFSLLLLITFLDSKIRKAKGTITIKDAIGCSLAWPFVLIGITLVFFYEAWDREIVIFDNTLNDKK